MSEWFETGEKWYPSEYGPDDVLGTLNEIKPQNLIRAASLVKQGRSFCLSHRIYNGMPGRYENHGPFFYLLSQRAYDHRPPFREQTVNKFGGALCRVEMTDHLGTHLDSLNHISYDNLFYNGNSAYDLSTTYGTPKLGIDDVPPIVTRGIMVDCSPEGKIMKKGEPIMPETVEKFLSDKKIEVQPGDAIFFRTGVGELWDRPSEYNAYYESSPGIGIELAKWLSERKVSVTGSDTPATEVTPSQIPRARLPVHQHLITKHGIRLIDNINLNELSAEKVYQFMFVLSPLRFKGATASPVSPVAIV